MYIYVDWNWFSLMSLQVYDLFLVFPLIEVSFEELPERLRVKFERMEGERLDMGMAEEHKTVPGLTILLCPKATQRSIYGRESVVHEGLLRIGITDQWKV